MFIYICITVCTFKFLSSADILLSINEQVCVQCYQVSTSFEITIKISIDSLNIDGKVSLLCIVMVKVLSGIIKTRSEVSPFLTNLV